MDSSSLSIYPFDFYLKARDEIHLPVFNGATLRGGFGYVFKRITCVNRRAANCFSCLFKERCVYASVFECAPPTESKALSNLKDIPRPFIFEAPFPGRANYFPDEILSFKLILVGRSFQFLPYFILAFQELGETGLGKDRGRFTLEKIVNSSGQDIYESGTIKIPSSQKPVQWDTRDYACGRLNLNFITPARIKFQKDLVVKPDFHHILRSLLHRISSLLYFHCGTELKEDFKGLIEKAEKVKTISANLEWQDQERYSSKQDTRMKLGGFVGNAEYEGDMGPFINFLQAGIFTHIGKNCTFGLGKYEIKGAS